MSTLLAYLHRTIASQKSGQLAWFVIIVLMGMLVVWFAVQHR